MTTFCLLVYPLLALARKRQRSFARVLILGLTELCWLLKQQQDLFFRSLPCDHSLMKTASLTTEQQRTSNVKLRGAALLRRPARMQS
jgi:hypothetical protein